MYISYFHIVHFSYWGRNDVTAKPNFNVELADAVAGAGGGVQRHPDGLPVVQPAAPAVLPSPGPADQDTHLHLGNHTWQQLDRALWGKMLLLFVGCLTSQQQANRLVYLRDGSAQTILRAATLR